MVRDRAFDRRLGQEQIAVAENGGEEIIEVVRHAAGELTESFHPLRATDCACNCLRSVTSITELNRRAMPRLRSDQRALEDVQIVAVRALETVFAGPILGPASAWWRLSWIRCRSSG